MKTRWAAVHVYASICCNLNLWPFDPKINQHIYIPKYMCDQNWMKFSLLILPERDYVTFLYLLSQLRLSSVWNVGAPYSGGLTFRQNFFTAVYAGHPLTSVQNFTEIVLANSLNTRGVSK